ncbi:unnamed protein product, partial [Rangifer tarandus platyrhynchus]
VHTDTPSAGSTTPTSSSASSTLKGLSCPRVGPHLLILQTSENQAPLGHNHFPRRSYHQTYGASELNVPRPSRSLCCKSSLHSRRQRVRERRRDGEREEESQRQRETQRQRDKQRDREKKYIRLSSGRRKGESRAAGARTQSTAATSLLSPPSAQPGPTGREPGSSSSRLSSTPPSLQHPCPSTAP